MARPYWWFKNQDAKNARCSRWIVCSFFFTFMVTLKIKSGWKKVSLFSKYVRRFKNQDAKNARCSRWIVCSFFFTFMVTLKIKSGWKKVSLFSKYVRMLGLITSRCSEKEPALLARTHSWMHGLGIVNFNQ